MSCWGVKEIESMMSEKIRPQLNERILELYVSIGENTKESNAQNYTELLQATIKVGVLAGYDYKLYKIANRQPESHDKFCFNQLYYTVATLYELPTIKHYRSVLGQVLRLGFEQKYEWDEIEHFRWIL